ncbi:MAG: FixH family protein [Bdellovibrionota bacterium]
MKRILFLLFALSACANPKYPAAESSDGAAATSAQKKNCFRNGDCVALRWETLPTEEDFGSFLFVVSRNGMPVDPDSPPSVLLWMPSMGHGSSPVTVDRLALGEYRATKVFFAMKGPWEIRFQLAGAAGVKDETILPFTF